MAEARETGSARGTKRTNTKVCSRSRERWPKLASGQRNRNCPKHVAEAEEIGGPDGEWRAAENRPKRNTCQAVWPELQLLQPKNEAVFAA